MNLKEGLLGAGVIVALVISIVAAGNDGRDGRDGKDGSNFGAVPSLQSPLEVNGAQLALQGVKLNTANRTLCTVRTPSATSTGIFQFTIINAASYATGFQAGYGSTAGATTTTLGTVIAAGASASVSAIASTTGVIFPPNTFINLNYDATSTISATFAPTGYCAYQGLSI